MWLRASLISICIGVVCLAQYEPQDQRLYSNDKEAALGAQLAEQERRQTTPLNLAAVDNYALSLGLRLAAQMPITSVDWKFTVIRERRGGSTHEPIALPGGLVFIPSALILAANSESEFAGMLAHGMAHVAERHLASRVAGEMGSLATIPLIFMGGPAGDDENRLVPVGSLKRLRQCELEADQVAVKAAGGAGFDPGSLVSYLERNQAGPAQEGLSPLPPVEVRVSNLKGALQRQPAAGTYIVSTDLFQTIQERVQRVVP